jgi:predicted lipoprotein
MKKVIVLLALAVAAVVVLSSCKETLPKRFEIFVNQVEKRCDKFSEDDWQKANDHFDKLVTEYQNNKSAFNTDEKKAINEAIGRYTALVAKSGFNSIIDAFDDALNSLGGFLKGLGLEGQPED